ncbi:GNAT family N-acetyltransferase [Corynebacterium timonense]|uniref:L-amino acid N-acyltransferase YncA n=1 Tax=Corynebacterium timonense TaxID=441500 RepID=A0A1H1QL14_9CORY|nr:GNAT family N-acetyltransferase [Corynebacterium timonense]SDS23589.1 L-amino acid N-acyltransferase YncA [Corynebacterium timonense]
MIRLARRDDAPALATLLRDFNAEFGSAAPGHSELAGRFGRLLATPAAFAVLADPDVGFALVTLRPTPYWDGPLAVLDELYVRPAHRSGGVGSLLLARAEEELTRRGCRELHINVDAEDTGARRFYERHGYSNRDPESGSEMYAYLREL